MDAVVANAALTSVAAVLAKTASAIDEGHRSEALLGQLPAGFIITEPVVAIEDFLVHVRPADAAALLRYVDAYRQFIEREKRYGAVHRTLVGAMPGEPPNQFLRGECWDQIAKHHKHLRYTAAKIVAHSCEVFDVAFRTGGRLQEWSTSRLSAERWPTREAFERDMSLAKEALRNLTAA